MYIPISCLLTCFNERTYIADAIASVTAQTAAENITQILVVDDGSTDGSAELLDRLATRIPRLRVEHTGNRGIAAARNYGLQRVETPFVALLDGDDIWHPEKLARQRATIASARAETAIWYGDFIDFRHHPSDGHRVSVQRYMETQGDTLSAFFVDDGPILPSTAVLRMDAVRAVGGFDESFRLFEETDLWLRLAAAGWRFQHVPGALTYKRRRANSLSSQAAEWEPVIEGMTARWSRSHPELLPLVPRRRSKRLARIAQGCFMAGGNLEGWRYLGRALAADPRNPRIYAYGALACLPFGLRDRATRALKRLRARSDTLPRTPPVDRLGSEQR